MHAGGLFGYKPKYQEHITTEADFIAACDAIKMILYFRSLLQELNIDQSHTTVMYEDTVSAPLMANAQ